MKEKALVSACSHGRTCRWHGRKAYKSKEVRALEEIYELIPVCPEMLGGLPCPRPPVKTKKGHIFITDKEDRTFVGKEITSAFMFGAIKALKIARRHSVKKAFFVKNSPSCARGGIAGKLLRENDIEVLPIW